MITKPVVHARWKVSKYASTLKEFIECSNCGAVIDCSATYINENEYNYCPYCGAKMDEEVK